MILLFLEFSIRRQLNGRTQSVRLGDEQKRFVCGGPSAVLGGDDAPFASNRPRVALCFGLREESGRRRERCVVQNAR